MIDDSGNELDPTPIERPPTALAEELRRTLANDLRPVRPLLRPGLRAAAVAFIGLVISGFAVSRLGARPLTMAEELGFVVLAAAGTLGGWLAMRAAIPGSSPPRAVLVAFLGAPLAFGGVIQSLTGISGPAGAPTCLGIGLLVALVPWLAGTWLVRRGLPTAPALTGAVAGTAFAFWGVAMLHLTCPAGPGLHVIVWHGGVLVLAALGGAVLGVIALRR